MIISVLKPCPFCGDSDAEVADSDVPTIHGNKKVAVFCNACFCEGPTANCESDAIELWNRRFAKEDGK
jgi:Lar family restriction alleviation protein